MPDADPTGRPGMPGTGPEQTEHEQTGEREGRATLDAMPDAEASTCICPNQRHIAQKPQKTPKPLDGRKTAGTSRRGSRR